MITDAEQAELASLSDVPLWKGSTFTGVLFDDHTVCGAATLADPHRVEELQPRSQLPLELWNHWTAGGHLSAHNQVLITLTSIRSACLNRCTRSGAPAPIPRPPGPTRNQPPQRCWVGAN